MNQSVKGKSSREHGGKGDKAWVGQAAIDATDETRHEPHEAHWQRRSPLRYVHQSAYARTHTLTQMHAFTQARNFNTTTVIPCKRK